MRTKQEVVAHLNALAGVTRSPSPLPDSAAKVTYILKNHNGTVLAKHTDIKKLADEMIKYETQTGNETRIEIVHEGEKK
jgi:hypothetical protein